MRKLSKRAFDYQAERSYYSEPPTTVSDYNYLDPYYRALLGDYYAYFRGKRILDIGAGECLHGYLISTVCQPKSYVNLDLFKDRIEIACQNNPFSQMQFVVGDCFSLPFNNGSFDVVWGNGVLFRLRPLEKVMQEVRRVLKYGGSYLGTESNFGNPLVLLKFMLYGSGKDNRNDGRLSHKQVRKAFGQAGLKLKFRFFTKRVPWLRNRLLSTSMGLMAQRD